MFVEIISVNKKKETDVLTERENELREKLDKYGYSLKSVTKALMNPVMSMSMRSAEATRMKLLTVLILTGSTA